MNRDILYYPTIEFREEDYYWLWTASLLWEKIYRIVPEGYKLSEPRNITELCSTGEIGIPLSPRKYSERASELFLSNLNNQIWNAAALEFNHEDIESYENYTRLHKEKVDVALRNMLLIDDKMNNEEWLYVPKEMANIYMTYLANFISSENSLDLSTHNSDLWTASMYFLHDNTIQDGIFIGEDYSDSSNEILASIYLDSIIPRNIFSITPKQLLDFRNKRKDERNQFISAIEEFSKKMSTAKDNTIMEIIVNDEIKKVQYAIQEYKKSMDIINATQWVGGLSTFLTIAVDAVGYIAPSTTVLKPLTSAGIGLGAITGMASKLIPTKTNQYSYLMNINSLCNEDFNNYNYQLYRKIEEFIND